MPESQANAAATIVFSKVYKSYGDRVVLADVNFTIDPGEFVLLGGASGSGKTTLLRLLLAQESPDHGRISVAGRVVHRLTDNSLPYYRRNVGVVFQDLRLIPDQSVAQNVQLAASIQGVPWREVKARACMALELVGLGDHAQIHVDGLPRETCQRVAIARAIAQQPAILLADEPTESLNAGYSHAVLDLFARLAERGTTVIVASRSPLVMGYARAGRMMCIQDGRVEAARTRTLIHEQIPYFGHTESEVVRVLGQFPAVAPKEARV